MWIYKHEDGYGCSCEICASNDGVNYKLVYEDPNAICLCRKCLLKLKREIDDVVEKR